MTSPTKTANLARKFANNGPITQWDQGTEGFISDKERFNRDVALEIKENKRLEQERKEAVYRMKREQRQKQEEGRLSRLKEDEERARQKWEERRQMKPNVKNSSSVPYNFFTLDYSDSPQAKAMKDEEQQTVNRAQLRAANLYTRFNTINPITGEATNQKLQSTLPSINAPLGGGL